MPVLDLSPYDVQVDEILDAPKFDDMLRAIEDAFADLTVSLVADGFLRWGSNEDADDAGWTMLGQGNGWSLSTEGGGWENLTAGGAYSIETGTGGTGGGGVAVNTHGGGCDFDTSGGGFTVDLDTGSMTIGGSGGTSITFDGNADSLQINPTLLGFFGSTPIAKPTVTGSRGGNAALASLLTKLALEGLIVDSSS